MVTLVYPKFFNVIESLSALLAVAFVFITVNLVLKNATFFKHTLNIVVILCLESYQLKLSYLGRDLVLNNAHNIR